MSDGEDATPSAIEFSSEPDEVRGTTFAEARRLLLDSMLERGGRLQGSAVVGTFRGVARPDRDDGGRNSSESVLCGGQVGLRIVLSNQMVLHEVIMAHYPLV